MRMRWLLPLLFLLVPAVGCLGPQSCEIDRQCSTDSIKGLCLDIGGGGRACALATVACPNGYFWSPLAPAHLAERCVRAEFLPKDGGVDGATDAAPADAASAPDGGP